MRIAFLTRKSWPAVGGAEAHLRLLAGALAHSHDVRVLAQRIHDGEVNVFGDIVRPRDAFAPFVDHGVRVEAMRVSPLGRAAITADLVRVLAEMRIRRDASLRPRTYEGYARVVGAAIAARVRGADLLHVICGGNIASATVEAARILRVPAVVTPFAHRGQADDDVASARAYRRADAVIATLDSDADLYRSMGVDPARIAIAGVCTEALPSGGVGALRRAHGIHGPLVVFVGVRRPHKGVDLLLEAAPHVLARHPDATFAFLGPGAPLAASGGHVRDVGTVDDTAKGAWVEAADVLCLPSSAESFGLVVTEAWSVGTPVVTSDLPVLRELVGAGGGGLAVPREPGALAAGILSLLERPAEAKAMGEAGRAYWRGHYRTETVADLHERLYAGLVKRPLAAAAPRRSVAERLMEERSARHPPLAWR